jgi:hypothetical protein
MTFNDQVPLQELYVRTRGVIFPSAMIYVAPTGMNGSRHSGSNMPDRRDVAIVLGKRSRKPSEHM